MGVDVGRAEVFVAAGALVGSRRADFRGSPVDCASRD